MGYFHLSNQHNGSDDRNQWEKVTLKNTLLGRDVWHCKESFIFGPWSVLERHPVVSGPQDIYLMYACGPEFILNGANLRIEVATYNGSDTHNKSQIEPRLQAIHNAPFSLEGDAGVPGYRKRSVATIDFP